MLPPKIEALPDSLVPNFLPKFTPITQIIKVTTDITKAQTIAWIKR